MRTLFPPGASAGDLDDSDLAELYAFGPGRTVRSNFVSTLDGAATGGDGLSGSINDAADKRVFALQRRLCDAVLVGAGTARDEGYRRVPRRDGVAPLLVVVSHHAQLPTGLAQPDPERGEVVLVTRAAAEPGAIGSARELLGPESVWVVGEGEVDLAAVVDRLDAEGLRRVLCEGGPTLHGSLLAADLVDELALTFVGRVVGGDGPRIAEAGLLDRTLDLRHLVADGSTTLLGLWSVRRDG
jgi:riboflavin biosynthesis pyrimidine reductase